ncbi:MAG: hypothetical protein ACXW1E_08015 [Halobacteriota archaeon]
MDIIDRIENLTKELINIAQSIKTVSSNNLALSNQISTIAKDANSDREVNLNSLSWIQSEINLLLAFILSEPNTMPRFALFVQAIEASQEGSLKELSGVARALLNDKNLAQQTQAQTTASSKACCDILHNLGDNVIQFPTHPRDNHRV